MLPNPFDRLLKKAKKKKARHLLLAWNRGLGDVALGLYALVVRIRYFLPDAKITFLVREDLKAVFELLEGVDIIVAEGWRRWEKYDVFATLKKMGRDAAEFDEVISWPDPYYWAQWQWKKLIPKLLWPKGVEGLSRRFAFDSHESYILVQPCCESGYAFFRDWPQERYEELFSLFAKIPEVKVILVGMKKEPLFSFANIIDLRGETSFDEIISLLFEKCEVALLPDSGILSTVYYLDVNKMVKIVSLFVSEKYGLLRQGVPSPNPSLRHIPLISKNLADISVKEVFVRLLVDSVKLSRSFLESIGQEHLLPELSSLDEKQRYLFLTSIFDCKGVLAQQGAISDFGKLKPVRECKMVGDDELALGRKVFPLKKTACVIMAGGEGSRLGQRGPKGIFPIMPVTRKSLFQVILEKALATEKCYHTKLQLALMVSPATAEETEKFLSEHDYFGFEKKRISFFSQGVLPLADDNKKWLVKDGALALAPDGNGSLFHNFYNSRIYEKYRNLGIENIFVIPIENPLAEPFDMELLSRHIAENSDAVLKVVKREAKDNFGLIAEKEGKICVAEYFEVDDHAPYHYVNAGTYLFTMDFVKEAAENFSLLPLHFAKKKAGVKSEYFIFDNLRFATHISLALAKREDCFAPVKDVKSALIAKESIINRDLRRLFRVVNDLPDVEIELPVGWHYLSEEAFRKKTKKLLRRIVNGKTRRLG